MTRPVDRMAPRPIRLSWSQLRVHEECRQKAHLMRVGKKNPAKDMRNYFPGMVADRVMQQWLADPQPGTMPAMVEAAIDSGEQNAKDTGDGVVRWRHRLDRAEVTRFCTELVTKLEPLLDRLVTRWPYRAPHRFAENVLIPNLAGIPTPVTLVGEMDILSDHPDGPVVLDLKGTADPQYWRRCVGQLVFYDLAVLAAQRQRTQFVGLIQPMCENPLVTFQVTEGERRELWARIERMAQQIWAEDFQCKDGTSGCTYCEVRHACPRYSPDADPLGFNPENSLADNLRIAAKQAQGQP